MADLYTTIAGLSPDQQDIIEAELFARQILEAKFPDLDLREGTGLRDTLLRPSAFMLALLKKGTASYLAQNTLAGVDDSSPTEIVDSLMSNWFMSRNTGTYAIINVRLFFARQKNVTLPSGTSFSPDGTLQYYPLLTQVINASAMQFDGSSNEWYVDVELQASETGSAYNIGEGSLLYFSTFDPYFLHGEINFLVNQSQDGETNTQFLARAQNSISTRNLINQPSVISNLTSEFNYLDKITVIGAGSPYMFRDQAKLVFDQESPRAASAVSWASGVVTVTLAGHGFLSGQTVTVSGALPTGYNGQYSATVIDNNRFTYPLVSNPGANTVLPSVQSVTAPVYAHLGGFVDVYCGDTVEQDLVQLTLDSTGTGRIYGPVLDLKRSSVSGGASADTMPLSVPLSLSSQTYNSSTNSVTLISAGHGLSGSQTLTISGITQSRTITAISCSNRLTTVTCAGHGLSSGDSVLISRVVPAEYNGTFVATVLSSSQFTYVPAVDILSAGSGSAMLASNPYLDGTFGATVVDANTLSASLTNLWAGASPTGTLAVSYIVPFTINNPFTQQGTATNLTCNGNVATITLPGHGLVVNRFVTISGSSVSGYNGTWKVENILDGNSFQVTVSSLSLATSTSAAVSYTSPSKDVRFSPRQYLDVQFPASQSGLTVTFQTTQFKNLASIQEYLEGSAKVVCADYLARGFNTYLLDISVYSYNGPAPSSATALTGVDNYLASLQPGGTFIVSDLNAALTSVGLSNLQTPIGVNYKFYHRDLVGYSTGVITDYLDPSDNTSIFVVNSVTCDSLSV